MSEIKYMEFQIEGWGILQVSDAGDCRCGGAIGQSFQMAGRAGGVMDYSDMERLGNFLLSKVKEQKAWEELGKK